MRVPGKYLFLFILFICCSLVSKAQGVDTVVYDTVTTTEQASEEYTTETTPVIYNSQQPTDAEWKKLTDDKDFSYKDSLEYKPQPIKKPREVNTDWLKPIVAFFIFFTTTAGHVVLLALLVLIVGFVIYRIIAGEGKGFFAKDSKKQVKDKTVEIDEEDLLANDWEQKLKKALDSGDKRLAVRYSYMLVLQMLQHRHMISYRQDKTNIDYYRELTESDTKQSFRQLMRQYEYTWYGNFLPSQPAFDGYFETFTRLKNKLNIQ